MKAKAQRRAHCHGQSTREEVRRDEDVPRAPLGSRLAARFAGLGLTQDIPELRGEEPRPVDLEDQGDD